MQHLLDYIKKNFIYFIVALTIVFALGILLYVKIQPKQITPPYAPIPIFNPSPSTQSSIRISPSPVPTISRPESEKQYQTISENDQEQIRRDSLVGKLLGKLPYTGTNFSIEYNYSKNQFIATLKTDQGDAGNKELDAFLQTNQIENRSWLNNLIIKSQ